MAPIVRTVRGDVDPSDLGRTLTHEHLIMDFNHFYRKPPNKISDKFKGEITLQTVGYVKQYPYSSRYNLTMNDSDTCEAVANDLKCYKQNGGGTIVDNTTEGLDRDAAFLKQVSEDTDVHIVAGTGFYICDVQADNWLHGTKEEMYQHMLKELTEGFDGVDVRAGVIGEVASVWPIRDFERLAIVATAEVQQQVGCGVTFHPHRVPAAPHEIMRIYLEAGGRADKAVMSHLDRTLLDAESLLQFAELGAYCQFDLFGTEVSYYQLNKDTDMPSDSRRMQMIRSLVDEGRQDRVLMSHDIHTKHRLADFGGHGYSHIINNVLPRMKSRGFTQEVIDLITIENPARWLAFEDKL